MKHLKLVAVLWGICFWYTQSQAAIKLPAIIGDNMVLQQNTGIPVWGWSSPGEKIQVEFKGKTYRTITASNGKWMMKLAASKAGGPYEMAISDSHDRVVLRNILVGDVWIASGQSNMEFGIQTECHAEEAIAHANDSLIHFFFVPFASSLQPNDDIVPVPAGSMNGKWIVCSPATMAMNWAWHGFSAIGYYFAREIRKARGIPVGMIGTYKGGTPAQAWVSISGLQKSPAFTKYIEKHQSLLDHFSEASRDYPQKRDAYQEALKQWNARPDKNDKNRPAVPLTPDGGFNAPSNLFNAMIHPLIPYAFKGVIWYQGESNGDRMTDACEYTTLFPRLINDWREKWDIGKFPFLFVQLANFRAQAKTPSEGIWPWVREAQRSTLGLPATGMAVIDDIGDANNIHPADKLDVGLRLSLAARCLVYGEKVVYSGPVYQSMTLKNNRIYLEFTQCGSGLIMSRPPWTPTGVTPAQPVELTGFAVAGADQKFVWAKAIIEGNSVIVYSDEVKHPVAVRYNWADNPSGNLYNEEGLPASPFRTDNWPCQADR